LSWLAGLANPDFQGFFSSVALFCAAMIFLRVQRLSGGVRQG
jgi:hypothetical protein